MAKDTGIDLRVWNEDFCFNCYTTETQVSVPSQKKEVFCPECGTHMDYYKHIDLRVIMWEIMMRIDRSLRFYVSVKTFNNYTHFFVAAMMPFMAELFMNINIYFDSDAGLLNKTTQCTTTYKMDKSIQDMACENLFMRLYSNPQ